MVFFFIVQTAALNKMKGMSMNFANEPIFTSE